MTIEEFNKYTGLKCVEYKPQGKSDNYIIYNESDISYAVNTKTTSVKFDICGKNNNTRPEDLVETFRHTSNISARITGMSSVQAQDGPPIRTVEVDFIEVI